MGTSGSPKNGDSGRHIEDRHFRLVDPEERFDSDSSERDGLVQHVAAVEFKTEKTQIVVTGRLKSGSRSCMTTVLDSATYTEESDTLTVVVFDDFDESADACTAEITVVPYTVTVTMNSTLPETVVVKHRDDGHGIVFNETFSR